MPMHTTWAIKSAEKLSSSIMKTLIQDLSSNHEWELLKIETICTCACVSLTLMWSTLMIWHILNSPTKLSAVSICIYDIYIILNTGFYLVASEDHTESDCILIALMTHGDDGILYAKDQQYKPEKLWSYFTSDQCPTLAGKPKIFFIQVVWL